MSKYGIFLMCNEEITKKINDFKKHFLSLNVNNNYLDHPVHVSLYVFESNTTNNDKLIESFQGIEKTINKINLKLTDWILFENDILTGLNTICIGIKKVESIEFIQDQVIQSFKSFAIKDKNDKLENEYAKSQEKYGYPFVGKHWIPHITVGSVDLAKSKIEEEIKKLENINITTKADSLHFYEIKNEEQKLIKKLKLHENN